MTGNTVLLRQVHPGWMQAGVVTSQAFRPTPKDDAKLSVYDGDLIDPQAAFLHFTAVWQLASVGVVGIAVVECDDLSLPSRPDPLADCPEHAIVDFGVLSENDRVKRSKKLKAKAEARGWLYLP